MSTLKVLLQTPTTFLIARRFKGKVNIQKPRKPHFEKQLLFDVSEPFYGRRKQKLPDYAYCDFDTLTTTKKEIDNPFERILARECLNWFNTSKMVVFLHMNPITMEDKTPVFAALKKNNMHLRTYGKKIVSMATKGTRYEVVSQLFTSHQNIIFGQPNTADKMFKILKKTPQLVVMAGIIEDRLMSKNELVDFSKLPNLEVARSQLCAVLQSAGSCVVNQLNQNQQILVSHLDKHVELQKAPQNEETSDSKQNS